MSKLSVLTVATIAATFAAISGFSSANAQEVQSGPSQMLIAKSPNEVKKTIDGIEKYVKDKGFFVAVRVPHSTVAKDVDMELRPTELIVFGKPRGGTPLMQCNQRSGIALPLKVLAWKDEDGQVWVGTTDPKAIQQRFELGSECDEAIASIDTGMRDILGSVGK